MAISTLSIHSVILAYLNNLKKVDWAFFNGDFKQGCQIIPSIVHLLDESIILLPKSHFRPLFGSQGPFKDCFLNFSDSFPPPPSGSCLGLWDLLPPHIWVAGSAIPDLRSFVGGIVPSFAQDPFPHSASAPISAIHWSILIIGLRHPMPLENS